MKLPPVALGSRELKKQKPYIRGTDVRRLQQVLKWMGLYRGRVDGVFGPETEYAVRLFQRYFKDKPSGIAGERFFKIFNEIEKGGVGEWGTYQRDFCHTGYVPVPLSSNLKVSKMRKIREPVGLNARRNVLYVATGSYLEAFDLHARKVLWRNEDFSPLSCATVTPDYILIPAGELVVVDTHSGKTQKRIDLDVFPSPVAVHRGVIYAASTGGSIYAIDGRGETLWRYRTGSAACSPPAAAYDLVYFGSYDRHVYCLDEKGLPYWKARTAGPVKDPPAVFEGRVFAVTRDAGLYALNALTGQILWKKKFAEEITPPAFFGDSMITVTLGGRVLVLDSNDGKLKWEKEMGAAPTIPPFACRDAVFIGTDSGLFALDPGGQETKTYLEGEKITCLAQARLSLYVTTEDSLWELSPL
ncbi:PQQ-binding-like beta-propeller repeat protein [Thermosediminibacter litoriperuensis]|uniref:Outer membrane protein assembly factor BamB n=1 Tax=Thermosediminibacter litoriperuensis TaxID=291989 RepID=A0A5S5AGC8_9FIRM|nr:PQQ-binding-like beta-propeller repeat protein [Thermosediminibacter litoriperuensis]TYP49239.1 outer membrane protein assembly factor BamB [Thermosediminibacter litoriperuensis]